MPRPKKVIYKGKEYYIRELAKMLNVTPTAICNRIKRGRSLDEIGTIRRSVKTYLINGQEMTKQEICDRYGISKETIRRNVKNGTIISCLERAKGYMFTGKINFLDGELIEQSETEEIILPKIKRNKTAAVKKGNDMIENFDPSYESVRKLADKYNLKRSAVYPAMESGKYTIKYYNIRGARSGFILRTEIEPFLIECTERNHEKAEAKLKKQNERKLTLEELKKLHPLVKDERFFEESFFPHLTLPITYEPENYD